ncbi:hypothetical protein JOM56_001700 [Amanita muscaria]
MIATGETVQARQKRNLHPQTWCYTPRPILFVHNAAPRPVNEVGYQGNGEVQDPQERSRTKQVYRTSLVSLKPKKIAGDSHLLIASGVVPCFALGHRTTYDGWLQRKPGIGKIHNLCCPSFFRLLSLGFIKCLVEPLSNLAFPASFNTAQCQMFGDWIEKPIVPQLHIRIDALRLIDIAHRGVWEVNI